MEAELLSLDNTKRSDRISCPRKYQLKWVKHITSTHGSCAIRFGVGFHGCMEGFYNHIAEHGWEASEGAIQAGIKLGAEEFKKDNDKYIYNEDDYRSLDNLIESFLAYITDSNFIADRNNMSIIETEKLFKILIIPTPLESEIYPGVQPFYFTGKIDLEVLLAGRPWLDEFKTTGQAISTQAKRLHRAAQVLGYTYASRLILNTVPEGTLMTYHHISSRKKKDGTWGKISRSFERVPVMFADHDLANFRLSLVKDAWSLQQELAIGVFPMRHHSCFQFGTCTYSDLCAAHDSLGNRLPESFFIDDNPWDVLKDEKGEEKPNVVLIEQDDTVWDEIEREVLGLK